MSNTKNEFQCDFVVHIPEDRRHIMKLFGKKTEQPSLVCRICEMEFSDPDRTMRHMVKAHSKPTKERR